ncbi:Transposable element P transposase [Orchesella cincta]|uniref:Transposable element P transposase n=1 Tax=Orchesella cincta TaxID=48709 RepID=A0A1D2N9D3_ORCCI|nr:Transposable element P transposase [Orchesella cincta]
MRYQADWLLQALLLKITSPKCYRKLRASKFGFSPLFLESWNPSSRTNPCDCQVMLMCDEMGVQEGISFEKMTKKFKGYIDYADFTEYAKERKLQNASDHCLTQPIACFATRGAAPGNILAKMLISAIKVGLQVVGFVSDGAATNKSMWRELGIPTNVGSGIVNSITNPVDEGRQVFFLCDIPHILKCIRKTSTIRKTSRFAFAQIQIIFDTIRKMGEQIISWTYYKALYDVDNKSDLRIVPKLTPRDIAPGPFQKMSVASAAHVFSNSTANGLKAYREIGQNNFFQKSEPTENFTRLLNDLFDACNGRIPMDGLRPENAKYKELKIIKEFLAAMSPSDTYASDQTFVSLQVTLTSLLELTHYLCNVIGYHYVLAGKCNQDPLEQINEDHGYSIPHISRCIVYQFSGFLAYKGKAFTKCVDCIESLIDRNPNTHDMRLTAMKDFGGLKYPSQALFNMINDTLEPALHNKLSSPDAVAEFVPSFIENLPNMNAFGCTV